MFPSAATIADGSYPLVDSITLYLHPAAPAEAENFCKFAAGPQGAKSVKQFGLWPECELEKVRLTQNLAQVKKGRGTELSLCDFTSSGRLLNDLASEFMKVKTALRLDVENRASQDEEVERLSKGAGELLLVNRPLPTKGWLVTDRGQENSNSFLATSDGAGARQGSPVANAAGKAPRLQLPHVVPTAIQHASSNGGIVGNGNLPTNCSVAHTPSAIGPPAATFLPTLSTGWSRRRLAQRKSPYFLAQSSSAGWW